MMEMSKLCFFRAKTETKKTDESVSSESTPAATEAQQLPQLSKVSYALLHLLK